MKAIGILVLKLCGFVVVYLCWRAAADHAFSFWAGVVLVWGAAVLMPLVAGSARWLLDRKPTAQRAALLAVPVHYLEMILIGCALIVAFPLVQAHPWVRVWFPQALSLFLMGLFGIMGIVVVLNLAVRGLGLPFAALLSRRLATDWLYKRCRNPMGLMTLLFFLASALWLQSLHAVVWVVCWLAPAWILFVKLFEERELEIRFGAPYLAYKAKTPFFL